MTYIPLKVRIKLFLKQLLPTSLFKITLTIWRNTYSKLFSDFGMVDKYTAIFIKENSYRVVGGLFKGMEYVTEAAGSSYLVKLVGSYEAVLNKHIEAIIKGDYTTMIDIGCAEGYYLVGIGQKKPSLALIGYDIDAKALSLTKELHKKNKLTNPLTLLGACTFEDLNTRIDDKTFILCDAEGFEAEILDPSKSSNLSNVKTFIVELHDFVVPGVKELLISRFKNTHTINTVVFSIADASQYPFFSAMKNKEDLYTILRERGEQEQEWLIMERK